MTVSTSGLVPRDVAKLGEDFDGQIGLAISLHAADDETRTRLSMPINKKYPLAKLMDGRFGPIRSRNGARSRSNTRSSPGRTTPSTRRGSLRGS